MAYTAHQWTDGEVITAERLNALEQGLQAISADGAIATQNIADDAVTADKIADGVIPTE